MGITGLKNKLLQPELCSLLLWALLLINILGWGITATFDPTLSIQIFAPILCGLVILICGHSLRSLRSVAALSNYNLWFIVFQISFWLGFLLINYPGFYGYDAFVGVLISGKQELSPWYSYMYSIILCSMGLMDLSLFGVAALQVYIYISCLLTMIQRYPISSKTLFVFSAALSISPLILSSVLYLNRDTFFGLLSCYLMMSLLPYFFESKTPSLLELIQWCTLLLVTASLRQDGKIYLIALPVLFYFSKISSKRLFIKSSLTTALLVVGLQSAWSRNLPDRYFQTYELTAIFQPLHFMVYKRPESLNHSEMTAINKVTSVEQLKSQYTELYITLFHQGKYTLPVTPAEWSEFKMTYLRLIQKNLDLFLEQRATNFLVLLNLLPYSYIMSNDFSLDNPFFNEVRNKYSLSRTRLSNFFLPYIHLLYAGSLPILKYFGALLLALMALGALLKKIISPWSFAGLAISALLPLTGVISLVSYTQWLLLCPVLWFFACGRIFWLQSDLRSFILFSMLFIGSRLPILFLAAPEPHMSYFSPGMILPILIALLALLRSSTFSKT